MKKLIFVILCSNFSLLNFVHASPSDELYKKNAPTFHELSLLARSSQGLDLTWESEDEVCVIRVSDSRSVNCQKIPAKENAWLDNAN